VNRERSEGAPNSAKRLNSGGSRLNRSVSYDRPVRFAALAATSAAVADVGGRLEKVRRLADLLRALPPEEIEPAVAFLSGTPRQGRLGLGHAAISAARGATPAADPTLTIADVDRNLADLGAISGKGSSASRVERLRTLFARATGPEQDFLTRLLYGELRQGALAGVLTDAIARAANVRADAVRRAAMMHGDVAAVARLALTEGEPALRAAAMRLMRPIHPMLATSADDLSQALEALDAPTLEYKLDGARVQVHKAGDEVRVFSRRLNDVTASVPEVVTLVRELPARDLVLDGEALALDADGFPHPFQVTMRRFGRVRDVESLRNRLPLTPFFFDLLHADGESLIDRPLEERVRALDEVAGAVAVPRVMRPSAEQARRFQDDALARGHEGIMAKALASPYAAGRRGAGWLKVKQARALDLVVLAAEWGHGRRQGWLSNLHLGARDPATNGFVMLGKTFKGLTDEMLAWQTERLQALAIAGDASTVHVRPELVVEVAFNEIQESPVYAGGLALRFARVKRYRADKTAADADTIQTVRRLAGRQID
jgi:DNA ligase-1